MIRGLIFDFDGLILDTEVPELQSWQEVYQEHGCCLAIEDWNSCIGIGWHEIKFNPYDDLEIKAKRAINRDSIQSRRRQRFADLVAEQSALPGVTDYIRDARRLGLKVAVASSSPLSWIATHLERLELLNEFECIRSADDVRQTKPHPEVYLLALAALQVSASEAVAFEDSPNGIAAAREAGIYTVAVPNAVTSGLDLEKANLRLGSLEEMSLEDLIGSISQRVN